MSYVELYEYPRLLTRNSSHVQEYYGSKDPTKVAAIKHLYEQLGLPAMFQVFEEESYNLISTHIQQVSRGMPHELFFRFMDKIYRRDS